MREGWVDMYMYACLATLNSHCFSKDYKPKIIMVLSNIWKFSFDHYAKSSTISSFILPFIWKKVIKLAFFNQINRVWELNNFWVFLNVFVEGRRIVGGGFTYVEIHVPLHMYGSQSTISERQFSLSIMCVLGIELRSQVWWQVNLQNHLPRLTPISILNLISEMPKKISLIEARWYREVT